MTKHLLEGGCRLGRHILRQIGLHTYLQSTCKPWVVKSLLEKHQCRPVDACVFLVLTDSHYGYMHSPPEPGRYRLFAWLTKTGWDQTLKVSLPAALPVSRCWAAKCLASSGQCLYYCLKGRYHLVMCAVFCHIKRETIQSNCWITGFHLTKGVFHCWCHGVLGAAVHYSRPLQQSLPTCMRMNAVVSPQWTRIERMLGSTRAHLTVHRVSTRHIEPISIANLVGDTRQKAIPE